MQNAKLRRIFASENLHLYENKDLYLVGGRIIKYVDWVRRSYIETEEIKQKNSRKVTWCGVRLYCKAGF